MMADRANITTVIILKVYMGFRLAYLHLTWINAKIKLGHAQFDCEYVVNDGRYGKYHFLVTQKAMYEHSIAKFTFDLRTF